MSLRTRRPQTWTGVVGQERAITILQSILTTARFIPRGFIFKGVLGVGKTTTAYLFARALMCTGDEPLGCGSCSSCRFIHENGLDADPDFLEVDAASKPGVEHARNMLEWASQPTHLSRRRILIIDEAHRLSPEAWDVYLKPLESKADNSIFIFVTNNEAAIPRTIKSRCSTLPFEVVDTEIIAGLLASIAANQHIPYETEALRVIAKSSKGIIRDAIGSLELAASMGDVTTKLVFAVIDTSLEDLCLKVYEGIISSNQQEAVKFVDEAGRKHLPARVIECLFSIYARTPWAEPDTIYARIGARLPNAGEIDGIFLKWMASQYLPSDVLPLLVYELISTVPVTRTTTTAKVKVKPSPHQAVDPEVLQNFLNETI